MVLKKKYHSFTKVVKLYNSLLKEWNLDKNIYLMKPFCSLKSGGKFPVARTYLLQNPDLKVYLIELNFLLFVKTLPEQVLKGAIQHELIHIELDTPHHGKEFLKKEQKYYEALYTRVFFDKMPIYLLGKLNKRVLEDWKKLKKEYVKPKVKIQGMKIDLARYLQEKGVKV